MNYLYPNLPEDRIKKQLAKEENNIEFLNLFNLLVNLELDIFEWTGLPETCDPRVLELNLLYRGKACLYKDEAGIWSYGATLGGELTRYGLPSKGYAYALNGINEPAKYFWDYMDNTGANAVLCMDNKTMYPYINYILRGAYTISDAKRSLQTCAKNSKLSYIFKCSEEQKKSLEQAINDVQNNTLAIITSKDNDFSGDAEIYNANIQSGIISELWEYYMNIYDDFKDILGINSNKQSDKKERLINSEVMGDQEFVENNLQFRLAERKAFCERCNKYLGTNMSVDLKNKQTDMFNNAMEQEDNEDGNNNTIQNPINK